MRPISIIAASLLMAALVIGSAHATMTLSGGGDKVRRCSNNRNCGYTLTNYAINTEVFLDTKLHITPGVNSKISGVYLVSTGSPDSRITVCEGDQAQLTSDPRGEWTGAAGWWDTPPVQIVSNLSTACLRSRAWDLIGTNAGGCSHCPDPGTRDIWGSVECLANEAVITYNGDSESAAFTFTEPGSADIVYGSKFDCNMEIKGEAEWARICYLKGNHGGDPYSSDIYRNETKTKEYHLEVIEPLTEIIESTLAVDKDVVLPGESFIITVNIRNLVDWEVSLENFAVSGDEVGGQHMCQFAQEPLTVGINDDADAILVCDVPLGAQAQTFDDIRVSFDLEVAHPCTGLRTTDLLVPPVTIEPRVEPICSDGIDNDQDGLIDCLDPDCCADPACPYGDNASSEGLNGGLCCANGLDDDTDGDTDAADSDCQAVEICDDGIDNDQDGLIDCLDPDCCADPACPYGDNASSEGLNGGLCCANGLDDDTDGDTDAADSDCQAVEICDDGIDNDGDTLVDCLDPDCCADPACPTSSNEGANSGLCCSNGLDDDADTLVDAADPDCGVPPIPPGPGGGCHFVTCTGGVGCNSGCIGPCTDSTLLQCCPVGFRACACMQVCSPAYGGIFNDMVLYGESRVFNIRFGDYSSVADATVLWDFTLDPAVDYAGTCLITDSFSNQMALPRNDGEMHHITNLALQTTSDGYCAATIHALAPDGTEVDGSYMLDAGSLPPIGPNAQIPEIPAVIHSVGLYSGNPTAAQDSYDRAEGAVVALLTDCGSDCGGNAVAKAKLDDAWSNLKAAERYLVGCLADQTSLCRFSQYYSSRALQLAREGQSLL